MTTVESAKIQIGPASEGGALSTKKNSFLWRRELALSACWMGGEAPFTQQLSQEHSWILSFTSCRLVGTRGRGTLGPTPPGDAPAVAAGCHGSVSFSLILRSGSIFIANSSVSEPAML